MDFSASASRRLVRCVITAVLVVGICAVASPAFAYKEPNAMGGSGCMGCHYLNSELQMADPPSGGVCVDCHGGPYENGAAMGEGFAPASSTGPHGGYTTTTRKCETCHTVHDAPDAGVTLLPASSVYATCFTCHDGTGGWGVYNALFQRGIAPAGSGGRYPGHRYETTNIVPGGDPGTGLESDDTVFEGSGGTLTCSDCHSPHGSNVVTAYIGERRRIRGTDGTSIVDYSSSRLLKKQPTGAPAPVDEYGSDWCLGCHQGRDSGGSLHNHPVESATTYVDASTRFIYRRLAALNSASATFGTLYPSQLGGDDSTSVPHDSATAGVVANATGNRGYLMPWPRTVTAGSNLGQSGHNPICQQCHEDSRNVGDLAADGSAQAVPFSVAYADSVTWNGSAWVTSATSNPRFQNFPHETENAYMLVETADDLCTNCHAVLELP